MMRPIKKLSQTSNGFTIIELMIAISILSIILLMVTFVLMNIGELYTKGINVANVQDDTRNIIQNITTSIQYSGTQMQTGSSSVNDVTTTGSVNVTLHAICFGDVRFSYVTGFYSLPHVLWKDIMAGQGTCEPLDIFMSTPECDPFGTGYTTACLPSVTGSGSEMVGPHMHLASLDVQPYPFTNNLYFIRVGLIYGSQDLISQRTPFQHGNYICSSRIGQQFCATSTLSTVAMERISQ